MKWLQKIRLVFLFFLVIPFFTFADTLNQTQTFFVDPLYDFNSRNQIEAFLKTISTYAYFYIEKDWYFNLTEGEKQKVDQNLVVLSEEFDNNIYPKLTSLYGSEWKPGIDGDVRVTILFHKMREGSGGYFNNGDEYKRVQNPRSNEREMIYLNASYLKYPIIKSYLAHEFTHLITFNQKERKYGVKEEIWLNEARADYSPTYLGYDQHYIGSNLHQRIEEFLLSPSDSLTEWQGKKKDYGVVNIFVQYLVEHYGIEILSDSLKSSKVGLASLNEALIKNNFKKNIAQIFQDWTLAVFLNDCTISDLYCFKDERLKNLKITPSLLFLPPTEKTEMFLEYSIKEWSGNWYKIFGGGKGTLKVNFQKEDAVPFNLFYIVCKPSFECTVNFVELKNKEKEEISVDNFGKQYSSLILIPSITQKISDFSSKEPFHKFKLSIKMEKSLSKEELIAKLKLQIKKLKQQIAYLQSKIAAILRERISCQKFEKDLYYGMRSSQVRCLQEFLKLQGKEIYPEGLVTGFFGPLTKLAVIRFQNKYAQEILYPLGLKNGTGFVGKFTRKKINKLLNP